MFDIHMLPADHGDCLWIEYGNADQPNHILIDGGTQHSFELLADRINHLPGTSVNFELFVITHVDADHIGGALELLRNIDKLGKSLIFDDIWFNGWKHLSDELGDLQGELVTDHLIARNLNWNKSFTDSKGNSGKAAVIPERGQGDLPFILLDGGMRLTLLSPSRPKLNKLRERWEKTITKANLVLGNVKDKEKYFILPADLLGDEIPNLNELADKKFTGDKTPANGSSIAFLAEYNDGGREKSCLFTGDAHVDVLSDSLKRLIESGQYPVKGGRLKIDALKVSHHGSKNNISKDLLDLINCPNYLFSTNGQQFKHPDQEAVARVIKYGRTDDSADPKLFFNYKSKFNSVWGENQLPKTHYYEVEYSEDPSGGLIVKL